MNYLNWLFYTSFALLAILHQVHALPRVCFKDAWEKDSIDYCKVFGKNHIACKGNEVSKHKKNVPSIA